jgi:methylglutaconyl-CoA hydratase
MCKSLVRVQKHDFSGTIVLQRADKRNALSRVLLDEFQVALGNLQGDRRVRAVIVTGAGGVFCAGLDLAEMLETSRQKDPHPQWHQDAAQFRDLLQTMLHYPKPIIAAISGPALGGGAALVLASDIVVASPGADFGLPEPRRGLVAGLVSPLLVFRIGAGVAANLLMTSRTIEAEEAYRLGLYHEIVARDLVWARANEIATECARAAPESLNLTKQLLNGTIGEGLTTMLAAGAAVSAAARTTEAAGEGITAFLEKREANWV